MAEPRRKPTKAQQAAWARQDRALFLWQTAGYSYQRVADSEDPANPGHRLYESAGSARVAVWSAMARANGMDPDPLTGVTPVRDPTKPQTLDETRDELYARYEALVRVYMPKAATGDTKAAKVVQDALTAQANLRGAFTRPSPAKPITPDGEGDVVDQLADRRARRRSGGRAAPPAAAGTT